MIQYQRQEEILQKLEKCQSTSISQLAKEFYASEATVRRDLNALEKLGLVRRVYGGVVLAKYASSDLPISLREQENSFKKEVIAGKAAAMLNDGASIILDASSTVQHMIPYLKGYKNLTVITNSLTVAQKLGQYEIRVLCTGGVYVPRNMAFVGSHAEQMIKQVKADFLFFSSQGISEDGEVTDFAHEETEIRKVMLQRSAKKVFLCDSSKIGKSFLFKLCHRDELDDIICDEQYVWSRQNTSI